MTSKETSILDPQIEAEKQSLEDLAIALKAGVAQARADGLTIGDDNTPVVQASAGLGAAKFAPAVYALGNFICGRAGVQELTHDEAEEIAAPLAVCIAEILPEEYVGRYGHWVALVGVLAMVSYPRVVEYRGNLLSETDDPDALSSHSNIRTDSQREDGILPDLG